MRGRRRHRSTNRPCIYYCWPTGKSHNTFIKSLNNVKLLTLCCCRWWWSRRCHLEYWLNARSSTWSACCLNTQWHYTVRRIAEHNKWGVKSYSASHTVTSTQMIADDVHKINKYSGRQNNSMLWYSKTMLIFFLLNPNSKL